MPKLDDTIGAIYDHLSRKDDVREAALKQGRLIVRLAGDIVKAIHRKEDVSRLLASLKKEGLKLKEIVKDFPDMYHAGHVESAFMELSEAVVFSYIIHGKEPPGPDELGATPEAYVLGIADVIGELRREALDSLREGNVVDAERYLEKMDDLFMQIMKFDFPTAIISIRPKQDAARAILERTRSDIAIASRGKVLEDRMNELLQKL